MYTEVMKTNGLNGCDPEICCCLHYEGVVDNYIGKP